MGTHPIFESDFDCLTECLTERPFSLEVLATERETETSRTSLTSTEKSLRSDCEIDMDLLTLTTDETPRTQSRILMEAPSAVNEFDWSLLTDPAALDDRAPEIEAEEIEAEEMIDEDLTVLIEHDILLKSRICPAESGWNERFSVFSW